MAEKKPDSPPPAEAVPRAPATAPAKGGGLLPALVPVLLAPALTWAVAQFVLLPKITAALNAAPGAEKAVVPGKSKKKEKEKGQAASKGEKGEGDTTKIGYRFENVVVNLAGTMGTRYLKTSFTVTGAEDIIDQFDAQKPQLGDVTLDVLSSLTLADLEESGATNLLRERLLTAYNQVLGGKVAENLFFSEFIIQ